MSPTHNTEKAPCHCLSIVCCFWIITTAVLMFMLHFNAVNPSV